MPGQAPARAIVEGRLVDPKWKVEIMVAVATRQDLRGASPRARLEAELVPQLRGEQGAEERIAERRAMSALNEIDGRPAVALDQAWPPSRMAMSQPTMGRLLIAACARQARGGVCAQKGRTRPAMAALVTE